MASRHSTLRVMHDMGYHVQIYHNARPLIGYYYGADKPRPFIHPLCTPSGRCISLFEPYDHPWHRGFWFSWKYLNGVNYWEEDHPYLPENARKRLASEPKGQTVTEGVPNIEAEKEYVSLHSRLSYVPREGKAVLKETRTVTIHGPQEPDACMIDWDAIFQANDVEVLLAPTPVSKFSWGGYAGLYCRFARDLANGHVFNSEGKEAEYHAPVDDVHGQRANWCAISGMLDGTQGAQAGLAIFDHPSNPRHPTPWHVTRSTMGTAFLFHENHKLKPGQTLSFRYRAIVFDGAADMQRLNDWYRRYSEEA